MICYRLKHLPTGLYYTSYTEKWIKVNGRQYRVKTNLSKRGEVFIRRPNIDAIKYFHNHFLIDNIEESEQHKWARARRVDFKKNEWLVETSTVIEHLSRTQFSCNINP